MGTYLSWTKRLLDWITICSQNRFWKSCGKLLLLLVFTFLPLFINIVIALIPDGDRIAALTSKVIPGEMIAYCLGLIAPLFLLLLKTHGKNFSIPALSAVFIISLVLYLLCLVLTVLAKNNLIKGIDNKSGHTDLYFWLSISFLSAAIFLRLYTDYQDSRYSDYKQTVEKQDQDFSDKFAYLLKNGK
jgi:hypothetical protein